MASAFIAPLIGGLAGLFGGGKQQKTQTSGTITNSGTSSQDYSQSGGSTTSASQTPNLSPIQQALINQFSKGASSLFSSAQNLNPYAASGLQTINKTGDLSQQILQNQLAARGQSFSPAAANAETSNTLNTVNQGSQFLNQLPLLQRQLQTSGLDELIKAFQVQPTGSTTTGTTQTNNTGSVSGTTNNTQTQQGTNLVSGNPAAGAAAGVGSGLFSPINGQGDTALSQLLKMFGGGGGVNIPMDQSVATAP